MKTTTMPLEDELGDVLEKALSRAGVCAEVVAGRAGVPVGRINDAIDYRSELTCDELRRIAAALTLNEVGLCALGAGRYPQPAIAELPFDVWPLPMPHGIGVANAYLVAERGASRAILFDTGAGIVALDSAWPAQVKQLDAVFLTHVETEHAGGLCDVVARFGVEAAFIPRGAIAKCGESMGEGETRRIGALEITAFTTPVHAAEHNCYLVQSAADSGTGLLTRDSVDPTGQETRATANTALLVSGDLLFAGSVGGAYFCHQQLQSSLRRVLRTVPPSTIIAPGHGPMTTVENELRFNPFVV